MPPKPVLYGRTKDRGSKRYQPFFRQLKAVEGPREYTNFKTTVWRFRVEMSGDPLNITMTHETSQDSINEIYDTLDTLLTACLEQVFTDSHGYGEGLVHLSLDMPDFSFYFNYNPVGSNAVTLNQLLNEGALGEVINQIAQKVQSGKDIFITPLTEVIIYLYENKKGGARLKIANKQEFILKTTTVAKIFTPPGEYSCAARAMCAGLAQHTLTVRQWKNYKSRMKNKGHKNTKDAMNLLWQCQLSRYDKAGKNDLTRMAEVLRVRVHVLDATGNCKPEYIHHYPEENPEKLPDVFLLLNNDHYDLITNITGFHRAFTSNNRTQVCDLCQTTLDGRARSSHKCDFTNVKKRKTLNMRIRQNIVDTENPESYIPKLERKPPSQKRILFYDVETMVEGVHTETQERQACDPLPQLDEEYYTPMPFVRRRYNTGEYKYHQVIYLIIVQDEEGNEERFQNNEQGLAIDKFMDWLCLPMNKSAILLAHFGSGFDNHYLLRETLMGDRFTFKKEKAPIMKGQKILSASIVNDITLLDSYQFVASPLSSFPKIFGLDSDLAKGYFPHTFARLEHMNYEGPIPAAEWYEYDLMKKPARKKFLEWHQEQVDNQVTFNFMDECLRYCSMDVTLLRQGMMKLRDNFMTLTDMEDRPIGIDIFQSATIPGVCFRLFRTYFMEENTICSIQPPSQNQYSAKQIYWLDWVMRTENIFIQHALNGGEHRVEQQRGVYPVDGYCAETNTIYQFDGCCWHGCPRCYSKETKHPLKTYSFECKETGEMVTKNVRMGELFMATEQRNFDLRQRGYNLVIMWECDWDKLAKKHNIKYDRDELHHRLPLNPRDAFFGGRVECITPYWKAKGTERAHYVDVNSMYPAVMKDHEYPIGPPTVLKKGRDAFVPWEQFLGVAKIKIRSPSEMHLPFLPHRSKEGKVLFALGTFIGTYTSVEIKKALSLGYVIEDVFEQWHYPRSSTTVFSQYIDTFYEMKRKAKEQGNKGLALISKLCLNSLYGKFGQSQKNMRKTIIVTNHEELNKYLFGHFDHVSVTLLTNKTGYCSVTKSQNIMESPNSNVVIAGFITAHARTKLYTESYEQLGDRMLYADTDSCIYVSETGEHLIPLDTTGALGLWSSELEDTEDYFTEFTSSGPKSYCLISKSGEGDMVKTKGFSLHYKNSQLFNFQTLKEQIVAKASNQPLEKMVLHKDEMMMVRNMLRIEVRENRGKKINLVFDKRVMKTAEVDEEGDVVCIKTNPVVV